MWRACSIAIQAAVWKNKIKIEIQMPAINRRRKRVHFYTTEYAQVSKICAEKLNCKSQINKSGRKKQTPLEHFHDSSVGAEMHIKV